MPTRSFRALPLARAACLAAFAFVLASTPSQAAQTDLATVPVAGVGQAAPKPNIMLLMDTSRSMAFTHMPDELEGQQYVLPVGYRSAQCNSLYYDPNKVYGLPKNAGGAFLPAPTFTAARYSAYSSTDLSTTDLSARFRAYDKNTRQLFNDAANDTEQAAYYYVFQPSSGPATALDYRSAPCTDMEANLFPDGDFSQSVRSAPTTGGTWKRKLVTAISGTGPAGADERQNFAIWYTYYRTRMAMVKSSVSLAFAPLTEKFRIGLISINPLNNPDDAESGVAASKYLAIDDFAIGQKTLWYSKLFAQAPEGSSPAREGLARVGRHYAGRTDGINRNMTPDPVTNSCQQNFTIMTTDGYWNTAQETRGPVGIDGVTLVGQQDGILTPKTSLDRNDPLQYSHRPIWDGSTSGTRTDVNRLEQSRYAPCSSGEFYRSTSVVRRATTQTVKRTQGLTVTTAQTSMSTSQTSMSTSQTTRTTSSTTRQTLQNLASTAQTTQSTRQELKTVTWTGRGNRITYQSTSQVTQSTSYTERTQTTREKQTSQTLQSQTQTSRSTSQVLRSTSQNLRSTSQLLSTTSQVFRSTNQPLRSTSQTLATTTRRFERTSQLMQYNGKTEQSVPVGSCTPGGDISCYTLVTGPTAVASCTPQSAAAGNNYLERTCDAPVVNGPTAVASCTPTAPSGSNNYTETTCSTSQSGPTPVASCTAAGPAAGNGYTTTTCSSNSTPSTLVASCTPGTDASYTTTSCNTVSGSPTPVASCSPSAASAGNGYTTTSCSTATTSNVPVASCSPSGANAGNNYVATTCSTATTGPTGVASCSPASANGGNNYVTTTCNTATTGPTLVSSCTPGTNTSTYVVTTCNTQTVASATPVASCSPQPASSANGYTATVCSSNDSGWSSSASCTPIAASASNNYTETQCRDRQTQAPTRVSNCSPGTSGAVTTTCNTTNTGPTGVPSCNASGPSGGNGFTTTTCNTVTTGPTAVSSCTPESPNAGNGYTTTTCNAVDGPETPVASCTPVAPGPGNGYNQTVCTTHTDTFGVAPGTCVPQSPNVGNGYTTVSCPAPVVTGPTPVPLNSCNPQPPSAANQFVARTCNTTGPTAPTPVASCTPGTAADFTVTTCSTNNSAVAAVPAGSCTASGPTAGNQYTTTVCNNSSSTVGVPAGSCTPVSPTAGNGYQTTSCNTVNTGPTFVPAASCTAGTDNNYKTTTCNTVTTGPTLVASCTPGTDANNKVTTCNTVTNGPTAIAPGSTCNSEAPSAANNWTRTTCVASDTSVGVAAGSCTPSAPGIQPVVTCSTNSTPATPVASCSAGTDSDFVTTTCTSEATGPDRVTSCTAVAPTAGNGYTTTSCAPITGQKVQIKTRTVTTTYTVSGTTTIDATGVSDPPQDTGWSDVNGMCYVAPQSPPAIDTTPDWQQSTTGMPAGCSAWPCRGTVDTSTAVAGSLNSLADVAQYYYVTDLRPSPPGVSPDPWKNDVPKLGSGAEDDRAPWQHMTTFVLGLGVSGAREYRPDYKSALTGDFAKIRSYENTPLLNWPVWPTAPNLSPLAYNDPRSIDDFWHTAVNGRGKFFSAKDPDSVVQGLREALAGIEGQAGAGAGAATSSLTPTAGDNTGYIAGFVTSEWTGELTAQDVDLATGNLSTTVRWSARALLNAAVGEACDNRKIFTRDPSTNALVNFTWNTYACGTGAGAGLPQGAASTALPSALQGYFSSAATLAGWSHYALMTDGSGGTVDQRTAARGANLVNYLRGQRGNEGFVSNAANKLYRARSHILGDIVNSQPTYVKAPSLSYQDTGYAAFKSAHAARTPMVYVGANDGMLHAFFAPSKTSDPYYARAGEEAWAFVPTAVISKLWKLADTNYADKHIFLVDGTPVSGDVRDPATNTWKTILVGGLNGGGSGYYALDVTDPVAPKVMWEFNQGACAGNPVGATADCQLGLTYGRPVITKLKNGKWVVMVTSGYNNTTASGADGKGYLYVLDAITGQIISRIGTGAGNTGTPSGLRELNFFVNDIAYDNTAQRVYGGDVLGNVWRFDVNDIIAPGGLEATLLGTARDGSGNAQPITTRPELAEVSGSTMVMVATGRMMATADLTDVSQQTVYAMKDPLSGSSPVYANLRTALKPMRMTQVGSGPTAQRTIACDGTTATDCAGSNGWYIDLPDGGERVNVDMQTVLGTLVFASNVPSNTLCAAGGYSWLNYVNLINGEAVPTSAGGVVSVPFFENSVTVGLGLVGLPDGTIRALGRDATGATRTLPVPVGSPPPQGKRISWREIVM